jgi:hypothetical protein
MSSTEAFGNPLETSVWREVTLAVERYDKNTQEQLLEVRDRYKHLIGINCKLNDARLQQLFELPLHQEKQTLQVLERYREDVKVQRYLCWLLFHQQDDLVAQVIQDDATGKPGITLACILRVVNPVVALLQYRNWNVHQKKAINSEELLAIQSAIGQNWELGREYLSMSLIEGIPFRAFQSFSKAICSKPLRVSYFAQCLKPKDGIPREIMALIRLGKAIRIHEEQQAQLPIGLTKEEKQPALLLQSAYEWYQDDDELFIGIAEEIEKHGTARIKTIIERADLSTASAQSRKLSFHILQVRGAEAVNQFLDDAWAYKNDEERMQRMADFLISYNTEEYSKQTAFKNVFKTQPYVQTAISTLTYPFGYDRYVEADPEGHVDAVAMAKAKLVYGSSEYRFDILLDLLWRKGRDAINAITENNTYIRNLEDFWSIINLAEEKGASAVHLMRNCAENSKDTKTLNTVSERLQTYSENTIAVVQQQILRRDKTALDSGLENLLQLAKGKSATQVRELCFLKSFHNWESKKVQIAYTFLQKALLYQRQVWEHYLEILESQGLEKAQQYIEKLHNKSKALIASKPPPKKIRPTLKSGLRKHGEYLYMCLYAYPEGHYSTHKKNLQECTDAIEHLKSYSFKKRGYPIRLSGILGFKIQDGQQEDLATLAEYQDRVETIGKTLPDQGCSEEKNRAVVEKNVKALLTTYSHPALSKAVEIEDLNLEQKILFLFLSYLLHPRCSGKQQDPQAIDLLILYKYSVLEENDYNYVQQSAGEIQRESDSLYQRKMHWDQLSHIYGESLKHTAQHRIISLADEDEKGRALLQAFKKAQADESYKQLKPRQMKVLKQILQNPHIKNKSQALTKSLARMLTRNVHFTSDNQEQEFWKQWRASLELLSEKPTEEKLQKCLTELVAIVGKMHSSPESMLNKLLTADINIINRELSKYQPVLESEHLEKSIGGAKEKLERKSPSVRKLRAFFTKTKESSNARMSAHLCMAGDSEMWKNPNYFELVLQNEDTGRCEGLVMLLKIQKANGKCYLWFGPNPSQSLLAKVSSKACYDALYNLVCTFAKENNFDAVVVPAGESQILGECTNRGGDFPRHILESRIMERPEKGMNLFLFEKYFKVPRRVKFGKRAHLATYRSYKYTYHEGALVWERKKQ